MKAIMVMFDTLNRRHLPPYGNEWIHAPNFARLAARSATFDRSYVGSMPCMPARRELHTGRYNFLHSAWGPLEPYDDSMPELLREAGVYTHLATDHQHYWEDGGATYHNRYDSYQLVRGQEGDRVVGHVGEAPASPNDPYRGRGGMSRHDAVNRALIDDELDMPQARTFAHGLDFLRRNAAEDRWFLQLETFDPHEPFHTRPEWRERYGLPPEGPDWPPYRESADGDPAEAWNGAYAALISMCDHYLGQVLDLMDEHGLWDDTLLIVNTDHGFLLGEHDSWAKCWCPFYQEVCHTPLFIWDPRSRVAGERRGALVQTIDLPATILDYFGCELPEHMQGRPLAATVAEDAPVRSHALFGIHGGHVNVTDGHHVYWRAPDYAQPSAEYRLMPTHMRSRFSVEYCSRAELHPGFGFTKGSPVLRFPGRAGRPADPKRRFETRLWDVETDPAQHDPVDDPVKEAELLAAMTELCRVSEAPPETFARYGLS